MSLLPLLLSAWLTDFDRPLRANHDVVLAGLRPEELAIPRIYDRYYPTLHDSVALDFHYRPWMDLLRPRDGGIVGGIASDKDNFRVVVDVRQFKPEEIAVKVVDRCLVIEAKHEEKRDQRGSLSRQFVRRYLLPDRADVDRVRSTVSSDGVLTVTAPLRKQPQPDERVIKIELTGQPALQRPDTGSGGGGGGGGGVTEPSEMFTTTEGKVIEENEIREELTTQGQQEGAKPEK